MNDPEEWYLNRIDELQSNETELEKKLLDYTSFLECVRIFSIEKTLTSSWLEKKITELLNE